MEEYVDVLSFFIFFPFIFFSFFCVLKIELFSRVGNAILQFMTGG